MSEMLILLLQIYAGMMVVGAGVAFLQMREHKGNIVQRTTFMLWLSVIVGFATSLIFPEVDLKTAFTSSTAVLPSALICRFAHLTIGTPYSARRILGFLVVAYLVSGVLALLGLGFMWVSLPLTLSATFPLFECFFSGVRPQIWDNASSIQKTYLIVALFMGLHTLDYPFLRPSPEASVFGFSLMFVLVYLLSILVPMMATENAHREYSIQLESEVRDRTLELRTINHKLHAEKEQIVGLHRQLEAQRQNSAQNAKMAALGQMAGGVAHEINNPLATINLLSNRIRKLLTQEPVDLPSIQNAASSLEKTIKRIATIIQGMRTFSRDASHDPVQTVQVRQLVCETLSFCEQRFRQSGIRLELDDIPEDLTFRGRPVEISQVLLNLLNNAHDAVEGISEKWVRLSVRFKDGIEISVTDSGKGVPTEIRKRLFEPFFTTKALGKGTGLGLSVALGIVQRNGGELLLDAESTNTRFLIQLPSDDSGSPIG